MVNRVMQAFNDLRYHCYLVFEENLVARRPLALGVTCADTQLTLDVIIANNSDGDSNGD